MVANCRTQLDINHQREDDSLSLPITLARLVLDNLIKNADRYGNGLVRVTVNSRNNQWQVDVEDNGQGIPEEKRDEIFLAFSRLDKSRNANKGGFGLGLAIADNAARLLNWTISVNASALGGAKFTVVIPDNTD